MVNHGYQRPGIGYLVGDCFGVGYPPFELSSKGTQDYVQALQGRLAKDEKRLMDLQDGRVTKLTKTERKFNRQMGDYEEIKTEIHEGDPQFFMLMQKTIAQLTQQNELAKGDIEAREALIEKWEAKPLPGTT